MGFRLSHIFAFVTLTVLVARASHAALPAQLYWNSALPNTPMPKAVRELVQPADFMAVGGGLFAKQDPIADRTFDGNYKQDAAAESLMFGYVQDPVADRTFDGNYKQDPVADRTFDGNYKQDAAANVSQILGDPTRVLFFLEKDIHTGTTMKYCLTWNSTRTPFLTRKTADSIPFSSSKLPEILRQFSLKPGSVEAAIIKRTIQFCERPAAKREERDCPTSLESMIDFTTSKLGSKNIQAISTVVEKGGPLLQNYTITSGVKKLTDTKLVACHRLSYPYATFYCHAFDKTRVYLVPLKGADGTKGKAVAVCHVDTSAWSPKHFAFLELKVTPGTVPVCHFLKDENIAWFQK